MHLVEPGGCHVLVKINVVQHPKASPNVPRPNVPNWLNGPGLTCQYWLKSQTYRTKDRQASFNKQEPLAPAKNSQH